MTKPYLYPPHYHVLTTIQGTWEADDLLAQQGFYAADLAFAYEHATTPLRTVLDSIPESYHAEAQRNGMELNIDVRVHELEVGDYPATPGWHCDAPVRETEFSDAAPKTPVSNSLVINLSSHPDGTSNTVFTRVPLILTDDTMTPHTWKLMSRTLGSDLERYHHTRDGQLIKFSPYTPHCVQPAQNPGVRLFVRISQWVKPAGHMPGLTRTEQVYRTLA